MASIRTGATGRAGSFAARREANGRFDLGTALAYAGMLRNYPLFWFEEAGDPLDYRLQASLGEVYAGPMATGENLFSIRVRGTSSAMAACAPTATSCNSIARCRTACASTSARSRCSTRTAGRVDRCIPHGGHQMSLNIAAGLGLGGNESYPDLFQPFGGFPDGVRVAGGYITMPELPGIGFEGKADLYDEMRRLAG